MKVEEPEHPIWSIPSSSQENLPSSPPLPSSSGSRKLRKPPPITPNRFNRFFNPRTRGSDAIKSSRNGRELREITGSGTNIRNTLKTTLCIESEDLSDVRPLKRRRASSASVDGHLYSSPISSPTRSSPCPVRDSYLKKEVEDNNKQIISYPKPIRRSRVIPYMTSQPPVPDWRNHTADFFTSARDCNRSGYSTRNLPFCTAACNTNSLVALGHENGSVVLVDTDSSKKFFKNYLSIRVHGNATIDLQFSDDDSLLASAAGDQTARITDMRTQQVIDQMTGHSASLKKVSFQPGNDSIVATASRDGSVRIWDRRANRTTLSYDAERPSQVFNRRELWDAHSRNDLLPEEGRRKVSVTSLSFLPHGRSNLFVTGSDANSLIKLWDLRAISRRSQRDAPSIPVSTSAQLPAYHRQRFHGVNSIAIANDGSRIYAVCKDSTVYVYSSNHLVLGCSPELEIPSRYGSRRSFEPPDKDGAPPLYGLRHKDFRTGSFYVKSAMRKTGNMATELLAVGSSNGFPVIFPIDERHLKKCSALQSAALSETPPSSFAATVENDVAHTTFPIYKDCVGTALIRGHERNEITDVTWTSDGNLVTIADDYRARCWRERGAESRAVRLRNKKRIVDPRLGWARVEGDWDQLDEPVTADEEGFFSDEFEHA